VQYHHMLFLFMVREWVLRLPKSRAFWAVVGLGVGYLLGGVA